MNSPWISVCSRPPVWVIALGLTMLLAAACSPPRVLVSQHRLEMGTEALRDRILSQGLQLLGTPYLRAGKQAGGFDCSGLIYFIFSEQGVPMGHSAQQQMLAGQRVDVDDAVPGDLIFFGSKGKASHVGLVVDRGPGVLQVLHSSSSRGVIRENILRSDYWMRRLLRANSFSSYVPREMVAMRSLGD